jgi:hypothetical protein
MCWLIRSLRSSHYISHTSKLLVATEYTPELSEQELTMIGGVNAHFAALTMYDIEHGTD